jgi:integrase
VSELTRDNPLLSRVIPCGPNGGLRAVDCTNAPETVARYVRASLADNTRMAYLSDLEHFERWGGRIPASPEMVAAYIAVHAESLATATLARRLAAICKAHRTHGCASPTSTEIVRATMRGITRTKGRAQHRAKPLLRTELLSTVEALGQSRKDIRDRALLLLGFAGGFRRSELMSLNFEDIATVNQGLIVHVRRSKVDQVGCGRKVGIPLGKTSFCPVAAVMEWVATAKITAGALFRPINRHEHVLGRRLSGQAVSSIVKERVAAIGVDPAPYSGHSLRAGFVTSAAQAGVQSWKIRQQTGHSSDDALARYIRDGEIFRGNAAGGLL